MEAFEAIAGLVVLLSFFGGLIAGMIWLIRGMGPTDSALDNLKISWGLEEGVNRDMIISLVLMIATFSFLAYVF